MPPYARAPEGETPAPAPLTPEQAQRRLASVTVLDARPPEPFAAGHLAGAGRMEPAEFAARRPELPPRTAHVLVVHDEPALARAAAEALAQLHYGRVAWLDAPLAALPGGHASREPGTRLWRPSPFLARVTPRLAAGQALDLACGAGRDAVHLALAGWHVDAWDHDAEALARAGTLAARNGVALATRCVDIERPGLDVRPGGWNTIVVFRFLHRPLLAWIAQALAPGGTLVYETFRRGQAAYGRPLLDRHLLADGELAAAFPSLVVETYEESDPEGGPVMAHLLARRPAA